MRGDLLALGAVGLLAAGGLVGQRGSAKRGAITWHQWYRQGKLVRLLRTDSPGFRQQYAAAKRRYGFPTESGVIG